MFVDCSLFQEMIFPYLDNNLTDEATAAFLEHARICPDCQAALEEARSFEFGMIGTFVAMEPPADLSANIMSNLHNPHTLYGEDLTYDPEARESDVVYSPVGSEGKNGGFRRFPMKRFFGVLGTAAAAAALVFAVNLAGAAGGNGGNSTAPIDIADDNNDAVTVTLPNDTLNMADNDIDKDETDNPYLSGIFDEIAKGNEDKLAGLGVFGTEDAQRNIRANAAKNGAQVASNTPASNSGSTVTINDGGRQNLASPTKVTSSKSSGKSSTVKKTPAKTTAKKPAASTTKKPTTTQKPATNTTVKKPATNTTKPNTQTTAPIKLPTAAYGTATTGNLSQRLVAAYDKDDIYMPTVSEDSQTVTYYTKQNGKTYKWKSKILSAEKPVCEGAVTDKKFTLKNTTATYSVNTSIFSPDMSMLSMNARGANSGVWLSSLVNQYHLDKISDNGGGNILSWADNSSKFVFTDEKGNLYIAYPMEKRVEKAFDGNVVDVAWGSDNITLVFTAKGDGEQMSLYSIRVP